MRVEYSAFRGSRVVCNIAPNGAQGPQVGWAGTCMEEEAGDGVRSLFIAWDALQGNRAARRAGKVPVHVWGFAEGVAIFDHVSFAEARGHGGGSAP